MQPYSITSSAVMISEHATVRLGTSSAARRPVVPTQSTIDIASCTANKTCGRFLSYGRTGNLANDGHDARARREIWFEHSAAFGESTIE
jgi:hypothetical protein